MDCRKQLNCYWQPAESSHSEQPLTSSQEHNKDGEPRTANESTDDRLWPLEDVKDFSKLEFDRVKKNTPEKNYELGMHYSKSKKNDISLIFLENAAERDHLEAQAKLGELLTDLSAEITEIPSKNDKLKQALKWVQMAAKRGSTSGKYILANYYLFGMSYIKKDAKYAVGLYKEASDEGSPEAAHMLGYCYSCGRGVENNPSEMIRFSRLAVERNCSYAQYDLAKCHLKGLGVAKNPEEAFRLFQLAADQGLPSANVMLVSCYLHGTGVKQNSKKAKEVLKYVEESGSDNINYTGQIDLIYDMTLLYKELNQPSPLSHYLNYFFNTILALDRDKVELKYFPGSIEKACHCVEIFHSIDPEKASRLYKLVEKHADKIKDKDSLERALRAIKKPTNPNLSLLEAKIACLQKMGSPLHKKPETPAKAATPAMKQAIIEILGPDRKTNGRK